MIACSSSLHFSFFAVYEDTKRVYGVKNVVKWRQRLKIDGHDMPEVCLHRYLFISLEKRKFEKGMFIVHRPFSARNLQREVIEVENHIGTVPDN